MASDMLADAVKRLHEQLKKHSEPRGFWAIPLKAEDLHTVLDTLAEYRAALAVAEKALHKAATCYGEGRVRYDQPESFETAQAEAKAALATLAKIKTTEV